MSDDTQQAGQLIDSTGLTLNPALEPDDLVSDAMVIFKVVDTDGDMAVRIAWSPGLDWVSRRGLLEVARDLEILPTQSSREDDE